MMVLGETGKLECPRKKTFRNTVEKHQIQPTYDVASGIERRTYWRKASSRLTTIPTIITFALHFME